GLYTERNQFVSALGVNIYFPDEKYILRWRTTFSHYPDKFWGFGNNTPDSNGEKYVFTQLFTNPQLMRSVYRDFYVGVAYEMQHVYNLQYVPGGLFDTQKVTGKGGGTVSGLGLIFSWDSRNNSFSSSKGAFLQLNVTRFQREFFSDFEYTNYIIDARKYLPVGKQDVVAFQSYSYLNSGNVAIRNMAILGGSDIMRGYYEGRFTDRNMTAFQAEYRKHIWRRFGLVAFGGYGQVFNEIQQLGWRSMKYSFGGGVRFSVNPRERLNLRLDYGIGEDSQGWYFSIREAF
ncbi:MAG TPA: BamA/TamA family outer membrane protein, partial [Cyclobacteriaceae bacterium]|nr:BamA/TamA family outer membrane protein [Cyclobacteriaceae bacterium]